MPASPTSLPLASSTRSSRDAVRAFALVALATAWGWASDRLADAGGVATSSFGSTWKFPLIALGTFITYGLILGLGSLAFGRRSLRGLGWSFERPARLVLAGLATGALVIAMVAAVYAILGGLTGLRELGANIGALDWRLRVFFAVAGLKIALYEETLFRGDLLRSLEARWGVWPAVIASSVAFAAFHRTLAPLPLLMKALFGLVFALVTVRSRSLVPSAIAHALMWAVLAEN